MKKLFLLIFFISSGSLFSQDGLSQYRDIIPEVLYKFPYKIESELQLLHEDAKLDPDLIYYRILMLTAVNRPQIRLASLKQYYNYVKNLAYKKRAEWAESNFTAFKEKYPDFRYLNEVRSIFYRYKNYDPLSPVEKPSGPGKDSLIYFAAKLYKPDIKNVEKVEKNKQAISETYENNRTDIELLYKNAEIMDLTEINIRKLLSEYYLTFKNTDGTSVIDFVHKIYYEHKYSSTYYGKYSLGVTLGYYLSERLKNIKYSYDHVFKDIDLFETGFNKTIAIDGGYNLYLNQYSSPFSFISIEAGLGYVSQPSGTKPKIYHKVEEKHNGNRIHTMLYLRRAQVKDLNIKSINMKISTPVLFITRNLFLEAGANFFLNSLDYTYESRRHYASINLDTYEILPVDMDDGEYSEKKSHTWFEPKFYLGLSFYALRNLYVTVGANNDLATIKAALIM